jgi:hypothetical protein
MKVTSPAKALKERAMKTLFEQRFEPILQHYKPKNDKLGLFYSQNGASELINS